jgi:hypothetical protein
MALLASCVALAAAGLDPHVLDPGARRMTESLTADKNVGDLVALAALLQAAFLLLRGAVADLHQLKSKFNPRAEAMLMAFRDEADLARIGIALTRAYVPDASLRDIAGVAVSATAGVVSSAGDAD